MDPVEGIIASHNRLDRRIVYRPAIFKPNGFYYYSQCATTTIAAFANRHRPQRLDEYDPKLFANDRILRKFKCKLEPWSYTEYIASMDNPTKAKFYQRWLEFLEAGGDISSHICPNTKLEKVSPTKYKAGRLIQARHPTFNLAYGRYIKPLERALKYRDQFGKGTYDQIGAKVYKLANKYRYYTEGDHTTFDAYVTPEMLRLSHRFYARCFQQNPELLKLSKRTINNRATTRNGERYRVHGTRMSGDVDTSFGNCIINYYILRSLLADLHIDGDAIVNGDDFILFTNRPIPIADATRILRRYNMDTKLVPSTTRIHTVEFCRCRLILHPDGTPTMAFDPARLKNIYGCTYKHYTDEQYITYLKTVHHANYFINLNSPIHRLWRPLPDFDKKLAKYLDAQVHRILEKQKGNKPYTEPYLTPSFVEAYPDYRYTEQQLPIYQPITEKQRELIINHNIKEIVEL